MKKYLISVEIIDPYDEIEIEAKNLKEARKKAEEILDICYEIINIEEVK